MTKEFNYKIDLTEDEAFVMLCECLNMGFVLDESKEFIVKNGAVYEKSKDGTETRYDDRANMFVALRNVAVNLYPGLTFRGDNYIFDYQED